MKGTKKVYSVVLIVTFESVLFSSPIMKGGGGIGGMVGIGGIRGGIGGMGGIGGIRGGIGGMGGIGGIGQGPHLHWQHCQGGHCRS